MADPDVCLYQNKLNRRVTVHIGACRTCQHGTGVHGDGQRETGEWAAGYSSVCSALYIGALADEEETTCLMADPISRDVAFGAQGPGRG